MNVHVNRIRVIEINYPRNFAKKMLKRLGDEMFSDIDRWVSEANLKCYVLLVGGEIHSFICLHRNKYVKDTYVLDCSYTFSTVQQDKYMLILLKTIRTQTKLVVKSENKNLISLFRKVDVVVITSVQL